MTLRMHHAALQSLRPLVWPLALWTLHALALHALLAVDAFGRILGSATAPSLSLVLVLVAFYALRLVSYFILPGYCVVVFLRALLALERTTRAGAGPRP